MVKRCSSCGFNNRTEAAFCSWCGSPTVDIVEVVPSPPIGARVWLPSYIYAYDPGQGYHAALEWQQYELTY